MSLTVVCYAFGGNRTRRIAQSWTAGLLRHGVQAVYRDEFEGVEGDLAIAYGWVHREKLREYRNWMHVDLGYWGRREGGRYDGYHKCVLNAKDPAVPRGLPADRFQRHGLKVKNWRRDGDTYLLAGMSGKSAEDWELAPEEWERRMAQELKGEKVKYRPKPSWKEATKIQGAEWCPPHIDLAAALRDVKMVVAHHSNVAIDGLIEGVPCYVEAGPALGLSSDLDMPKYPDGREDLVNGLAWFQWNLREMETGEAWDFYRQSL